MKHSIRVLLPLFPLCVAIGAGLAVWEQSKEVRQVNYQMIAEVWPVLSAEGQSMIREAMMDGYISQWEYHSIFKLIMNERGSLAISTQEVAPAQGRDRLATLINPN